MSEQPVRAADSGEAFLAAMAIIDALTHFAARGERSNALEHLAARDDFGTVAARQAAGSWMRLFAEPLQSLDAYRQAYLRGAKATALDLEEAAEAANLAITAFNRKVQRAVAVATGPTLGSDLTQEVTPAVRAASPQPGKGRRKSAAKT